MAAEAVPPPRAAVTPTGAVDAALALLLLAAALGWFSLSLDATFEPRDEGYLLTQSARVAAGEVPHVDVADVYGPGVFALTGAVLHAGGDQMLPVRWLLAGVKALGVVLAFLAARRVASRPLAVGCALLAIAFWGRVVWNLNAPYAALFTVPVAELGLLLLLVAEQRDAPGLRAAAGVAMGAGVLFKQSLAIMLGYGLVLATFGLGLLLEAPGPRPARDAKLGLGAWAVAALAVLAPVSGYLRVPDYLLYFLPLHVLMGGVALAVARRGACGSLARIARRRLGPVLAGLAAVPLALAALYAAWGALPSLLFDMFGLPLHYANYQVPARLPGPALGLACAGVAGLLATGVLALAGRRGLALRVAGAAALVGATAWLVAGSGFPTPREVLTSALAVDGVQLAAIGWAGIACLLPGLVRGRLAQEPWLAAGLAIACFHLLLCFQGFPRAGPDLYLAQGAQPILLAFALGTWVRAAGPGVLRRGAAAALLALPLAWLAAPAVLGVVELRRSPRRPLDLPRAKGIALQRSAIYEHGLDQLERLVARLAELPPGPLFLTSVEEMATFQSGRRPLFADCYVYVFWAGWGLLSTESFQPFDEPAMIERLRATPEAIVVDRSDPQARRLAEALPALRRFLDEHYRVRERIGPYRLLEPRPGPRPVAHSPAAEPQSSSERLASRLQIPAPRAAMARNTKQ